MPVETSSPPADKATRTALIVIGALSAVVIAFLFWLIYFQKGGAESTGSASLLPTINATFNALSASFVISGLILIKKERKQAHALCMIMATVASACFLVGYLIYHYTHGHTEFNTQGLIRYVYLFILISHIILSVAVVPMLLTTLYFAAARKFSAHRKIARWTYPIWLYVSITGIVVYVLLRLLNTPVA